MKDASVAILSYPADHHTLALQWALERRGVAADLIYAGDFPQRATATFHIAERSEFRFEGPTPAQSPRYNTVWDRRRTTVKPHDELHPSDKRLAGQVCQEFVAAYRDHLADAFWINPPDRGGAMERKSSQLSIAQAAGFSVPETLISNDPQRIRAFVAAHEAVVVKALGDMRWRSEDGEIAVPTTRISLADLDDEIAIRACPMIYQVEVRKEVEYRLVVMGADMMVVEIDSQRLPAAQLDWRGSVRRLEIRQRPCPERLRVQAAAFMRRAGLVFGSFDLALSPTGDIVFFEINPQGQFLWIEELAPDILMLDRMAQFLAAARADFVYRPAAGAVTLAAFLACPEKDAAFAELTRRHMPSPEMALED